MSPKLQDAAATSALHAPERTRWLMLDVIAPDADVIQQVVVELRQIAPIPEAEMPAEDQGAKLPKARRGFAACAVR